MIKTYISALLGICMLAMPAISAAGQDASAGSSDTASWLLEKGIEQYEAGNYDDAIFMFDGVSDMTAARKAEIYADIYLYALAIPAISILGVHNSPPALTSKRVPRCMIRRRFIGSDSTTSKAPAQNLPRRRHCGT